MDRAHPMVRLDGGYRVGSWRVVEPLAEGSWSSVYLVEQVAAEPGPGTSEPRRAALKVVPTGTLTPRQVANLAAMVGREVAAHRRLTHPHLIRMLDVVVLDDPAEPVLDGATGLVLELAAGSAAQALAEAGGSGVPDAARLITEVCAGLAYLHGEGWVHGDLKPANILLMPDGSARLADFGLSAELTGTHAYLPPGGTSDYLPPERWAEGLQAKGVAVRQTADVWALGVTACQLLTGRMPFAGVSARARSAAAAAYTEGRAQLTLPESLTPWWREFITDCLAPDHESRSRHTADRLLDRLRAGDGGQPRRGSQRRVMIAAAVALVVTAGLAAPILNSYGADAPAPELTASAGHERWFRTDADIPPQYYDLIVQAGTKCPDNPVVTPLLIAAMLKAESNFDPDLSDPARDEYGIARWTPSVLQYYMPPGQRRTPPVPPFPPEMSIPPVGDYLCRYAGALESLPGDPRVNLAAAYRTSATTVRNAGGVPPGRPHLDAYVVRLRQALRDYSPPGMPVPGAS